MSKLNRREYRMGVSNYLNRGVMDGGSGVGLLKNEKRAA